jgi:hypothetical protein
MRSRRGDIMNRHNGKPSGRIRPSPILEDRGEIVALLDEVISHHETSPAASGGDIDADWQRAESSGEEAVGGSEATPDQDVVDEIGHALGVEQASDAPVICSEEILRARDRLYWHLERLAAEKDE